MYFKPRSVHIKESLSANWLRPIPYRLYGIWAKLNIVRDSLIWKCDEIEKLTLKTRKISRTERSIWFSRWKISYRHPQSKFWIFENFIYFSKRIALSKTDSFCRFVSHTMTFGDEKINYFLMSTHVEGPLVGTTLASVHGGT